MWHADLSAYTIWAAPWQNQFLPYANNKRADQPAHSRSLISAFVVHCLDSIPLVSISELSSLHLVSVAAQTGLSLNWSETPKTGFLVTKIIFEFCKYEARRFDLEVEGCILFDFKKHLKKDLHIFCCFSLIWALLVSEAHLFRFVIEDLFCLCWGLTSQSTIFQSCRDGATASWVINQYFRGVKCLAQGHNTAAVGIEPPTSRSGVRHSTTEPPRSPYYRS